MNEEVDRLLAARRHAGRTTCARSTAGHRLGDPGRPRGQRVLRPAQRPGDPGLPLASHHLMAELLLTNVHVYGDGAWRPGVDSIAVRDGVIVGLGAHAELVGLVPAAEVVDLAGRLLLPGFHDAHVHPVQAGLELVACDLDRCGQPRRLPSTRSRRTPLAHPDADLDRRRRLVHGGLPRRRPDRRLLDARPDRPAFLPNRDHHGAWVNSARAGARGRHRRRPPPTPPTAGSSATPDGTPTGTLHEGAMELVAPALPAATAERDCRGLLAGAAATCTRSASPPGRTPSSAPYAGMRRRLPDLPRPRDAAGTLTARVVGALWWDRTRGARADRRAARARGDGSATGGSAPTSVKIMQDGVAENYTAAMLEPYLDRLRPRHRHRGLSLRRPGGAARARHRASTRPASRCTSTPSATGPCARRSTRSRRPHATAATTAPPHRAPPGRPPRRRAALRDARRRGQHAGAVGLPRRPDGRADAAVPGRGARRAGSTRSATCSAPAPAWPRAATGR